MAEISDAQYEELRLILEKEYERTYTLEEAKEIGDGLMDFFTLIMDLDGENHNEEDEFENNL